MDPAIDWFDIAEIIDKTSAKISPIFNNTLLSRYSRPTNIIFDNGNNFKKDFLHFHKDFSIKSTRTIIKSPQVNSM